MANVKSLSIMPPAPELINSSSIYYRESHSSPVQQRQSQPLLWDDYRGKYHQAYDTYNNDPTDDEKSMDSLKTVEDSLQGGQGQHCPRSHRLEFAVFVKILFKLLDKETAAIKSQAKAMISSCLEKAKQGDNKNHNFRCSSSSSSRSSSRSSTDSGDDHHGRLSSSLLFQLENMELPLRSLVGESVWVCAYHYTKLYQQKHHRPSRIFRSNMQFNRDWLDYESSSPPPPSVPISSVSVSTTTVPRPTSSMITVSHPGCSTISLSSTSDDVQDPSNDEWDYLETSLADDESLYPRQDNVQEQDYHDYFDGGTDAPAAANDDDMVQLIDNLAPTTPTLITSEEVETEYYNFLRDAF